jgi:integrase
MFKDNFITVARAHGLRLQTERAYYGAAAKHIKWLGARSAKDLERDPTKQFRDYLTMLANVNGDRSEGDEGISASSQNLAFHALRFLYEKVIGIQLGDLSNIPRASGHERIVDVPPDDVAIKLVQSVPGVNGVALRLIYGTAGRLNDILRLRVKDLDFRRKLVSVQESKGGKSRLVPMPPSLIPELSALVKERERIHEADLADGFGWVHMPGMLAKKYPGEENSPGWQYLFASATLSKDPISGKTGRHHIFDVTLQRAFANARRKLRIKRHYTIHGLRHAAAQWMERNGVTRSTIQEILGHENSSTTDRYLLSGKRSVANVPTPI